MVTLHFEQPFGGLEATYAVHLRPTGKPIEDFLFVLFNFFARCYGWGAIREYRLEIGVFEGVGQFQPKC